MQLTRIFLILVFLLSTACTSIVRNPVPKADHLNVTVLGQADLLHWGDRRRSKIFSNLKDSDELEQKYGGIMYRGHHYLVISGGRSEGAYGAGVLSAWSELGTRPEFTIVTGVRGVS